LIEIFIHLACSILACGGASLKLWTIRWGPGHGDRCSARCSGTPNRILRQWTAGNGVPVPISVIVAKITGRPAHTFARWAADQAGDFR
jgi:hypothetical protein